MAVILLVDDDPMVQSVTKELLEASGYEVLSAETGAEALTILEYPGRGIDLVLLDLCLPDMNGRQLLHRIAQKRPGSRIIVCTGCIYESDSELKAHPAFMTVLQKPFNLRTLREAVQTALAA